MLFFKLYWSYNASANQIDMAISCQVSDPGYCGIGLSQNGSMIYGNGTDAIIVSPDGNGSYALDFFMTAQYEPGNGSCPLGVCADTDTVGCSNNVFNVSGQRVGSYILVQFSRPISASDACDSAIDVTGMSNYTLIWAWGNGTLPASILTHLITDRGTYAGPRFPWNLGSTSGTTGRLTTGIASTTGVASTTGAASTTTTSMSSTTGGDVICGNSTCSTLNSCETPTCSVDEGVLLCTYPLLANGTDCKQIDSGNNYCYTGTCQAGICQFSQICAQASSSSLVTVPIVVVLLMLASILHW